jgi:hypothetical protein
MQRLVRAAQCRLTSPAQLLTCSGTCTLLPCTPGCKRGRLVSGVALRFSSRSAGSAELPPQQRKSRRSACAPAASAAAPEPLQQRRRQSTRLEDEDAPEPPATGELLMKYLQHAMAEQSVQCCQWHLQVSPQRAKSLQKKQQMCARLLLQPPRHGVAGGCGRRGTWWQRQGRSRATKTRTLGARLRPHARPALVVQARLAAGSSRWTALPLAQPSADAHGVPATRGHW